MMSPSLWITPHPWLLGVSLICSLVPAVLFILNLSLYREPPQADAASPQVSVLIPARNEEASIEAAVAAVLASRSVELEVIVLDDASTDRTASLVESLAEQDDRVRLEHAPPLPPGWNGKQHACWVLSGLARYGHLCFLDADVRLAPEALARLATFQKRSGAALVSGFPRQETGTTLEWLLIPLIHFVLLGFLPFARMRTDARNPALAAGCGQVMFASRAAYLLSGGHAAIRKTMHDGLKLPRLFRTQGLSTDLCDLTQLARCRMYTSAAGVWQGLAKNATEGLAAPRSILPFTLLLVAGQLLPLWLALAWPGPLTLLALGGCYLPRFLAARRFQQRRRSAVLHPLGVAILLILQWYAFGRKLLGYPAVWKQRACDVN